MSSDLSAEITAIATAALAAFAVVTAVFAFLAYRKQTQEVGVLLEQNDHDVAQRRIAQAARVFTVVPRDPVSTARLSAKNASELPVFDAQFWYSEPGGASGPDDLGRIMPGDTVELPYAAAGRIAMDARDIQGQEDAPARAILTFRDAAGVRWIRMPDGVLEEQSCATARESALVALGVELPVPGLRPPGPGGEHKLPTSFRRLGVGDPDRASFGVDDTDRASFGVDDTDRASFGADPTIVVYPLSKGTLYMRGWSIIAFGKRVKVTSDDPDNQGVYTEERLADSPPLHGKERYSVSYDVWNYRDSPVTAALGQRDEAEREAGKETDRAALERAAETETYRTGDPFGPALKEDPDFLLLLMAGEEGQEGRDNADRGDPFGPAPGADAGEFEAESDL